MSTTPHPDPDSAARIGPHTPIAISTAPTITHKVVLFLIL
jgi:hypothetical protein